MDIPRTENPEENLAPVPDISALDIQPESRHECSICLNWLQDPVLTSCGHRFCQKCISSWLQQKNYCPIDNIVLRTVDLFPDNYTRREILQQRMICPFSAHGCSVRLTPMELESHVNSCDYRKHINESPKSTRIPCSFKELGCTLILKNEENLARHMEGSIQNHLGYLMSAYSKLKANQDLDGSAAYATEQEAMCLWEAPDKNSTDKSSEANQNGSQMSMKALIRALYERVVVLEQRNREQDITIGNLSCLTTALNQNYRRLTEDIQLKYCMGTYVWKIDNFNSKMAVMLNDTTKFFYSQGFYTSPNGYRFCARLNCSPVRAQCLALHLHVMRSEHDDILEWPFLGNISLTLINPSFPQLSLKDNMVAKAGILAFEKPSTDISRKGFGFSEYVSSSDIKFKGFIPSDSLQIKFKIQPAEASAV